MLGIGVCCASLVMPWYRIPAAGRFEKSGIGSFGFAEAALLVCLLAALVLIGLVRRGRRPPLPMHEGSLLAVAGIWSAVLVAYLMVDRPEETAFEFPIDYGLRYGIFVALGGALLLALGGVRVRKLELSPGAEVARTPTSPSLTRSPQ